MPELTETQLTAAQAQAALDAHSAAFSGHLATVIKAVNANMMEVLEVDHEALAASIKAHNELIDEDMLLTLQTKINAIKVTSDTNTAGLTALKSAVESELTALSGKITTVQEEGRIARKALDERITKNESDISNSTAKSLLTETAQDQKLADHNARLEAIESWKILLDARVVVLEKDSTTNKSTVAQMLETLAAHKKAIEDEYLRAKGIEGHLRDAAITERERLDALLNRADSFVTHAQSVEVSKSSTNAGIAALYVGLGIEMGDDALIQ